MKNQEIVLREIAFSAIEKKEFSLTQSELSKNLNISLSIINNIVKKLDSMGAVKIMQRCFKILNIKKILYYWASVRNIEKDIIFRIRVETPAREIERAMPDAVFTAFTAYKLNYNDVPADYSEVYAYADENETEIIKERLKKMKTSDNNPNLFILKKDKILGQYRKIPLGQIFVDLWNIKEWYAKDYTSEMENKLGLNK
ncbi:hypothetical protein J4447_02730 [Candidatus Pacearchaeota archaeon]|nr:hypothetical protein [Candidatus Pacearchaeota archaeon]